MRTREEFFAHYLRSNPVAHSLWRCFECERFAKEKLVDPVLDVGCGDGQFVAAVWRRPLEAGIDLDRRETSKAAASGSYRRVVNASASKLPFPDRSFGTVISNCVLEHIPDLDPVLAEVRRVLRPGGRFLLTVPSEHYNTSLGLQNLLERAGLRPLARAYLGLVNWVFKHYHVNDPHQWRRRLKRAGLRLETADYLIPRRAYRAYERWLLPALPSKVWKILFNRWTFLPRFWIPPLALRWFAPVLRAKDEKGVALFLAARRVK